MQLLDADLRCLDAHAHLGNLVFDPRPEDAIKHYEIFQKKTRVAVVSGARADEAG